MKKIWITLLVFSSVKTFAQNSSGINAASIGISYTVEPERKFKTANGGYSYNAFGMNARLPLFGKRSQNHFFETSVQADLQSSSTQLGFLNANHYFTNASLGLGAVIFNGGKNIYLVNAGAGMAADNNVIDRRDTRIRFSGSFIVNHQHSSKTVYQYGVAFTYAFGKPLPLPVLGLRTRLSEHWTLSTILPVELGLTDRINSKTGLSFSLRPSGNRFQFDNQGNFAGYSGTVFMQLREFQLASAIHYKISPAFTLSGEVGILVGSNLKFTQEEDAKNTIYETSVNPGALFRASLRYRLPRKKGGMQAGRMQELLNPLGN